MRSGTQGRDIALTVLVVLIVLVLLSGGMMGFGGMMGWGWGWGSMMGGQGYGSYASWGIPMLLFGAVFIAVIAFLAVWLLRSSGTTTASIGSAGKAEEMHLDILKRRYAKGEITKEQYEQIRKDLE